MAITGGIAAGITAIASVAQGVTQHQAAIKGRQDQRKANNAAATAAGAQQRKADEALAAAQRKTPDIGSLLTAEQQARLKGPNASLLTKPGGVESSKLALGRTTALGGA